MGFLVSPGVEINEIDLTNVIPAVSTSICGYAGHFRWGPTNKLVTISSEKELADVFGAPNELFSSSFLQAAAFLKYGKTLLISRALPDGSDTSPILAGALNASTGTPASIKDEDSLPATTGIYARYAGKIGDSLKIIVFDPEYVTVASADEYFATLEYGLPETDHVSVMVIDEAGEFTGIKGTVLETWEGLSTVAGAKTPDGANNYFNDVLNGSSAYLYAVGVLGGITITAGVGIDSLADGTDSYESDLDSMSAIQFALDLFDNPEHVDVNLLYAETGGAFTSDDEKVIAGYVAGIASSRKDCVGFCSAPAGSDGIQTENSESAKCTAVTAFFTDMTPRDSYSVLDSSPIYVYNKYTDKYNWIPSAGHIAGLCAHTDDVTEPWFSPAGYTRGQIKGVVKLAFNPNQSFRDTLYKAGINPIVAFPGQGIVLFGDKTGQRKPSAFDRINVRRLFIVLEKAIATAAKYQLFELNDEFTRSQFRNMVEPFLRDIKGRRGVTDFLVVCDETNNTGQVIDTNRFVADIYIKPARSINFITLNFVATRTGIEFSEVVGKF